MSDQHRRYTIDAMVKCAARELAMRRNVYPKWVQSGRMKAEAADHEISCMQAIVDTLNAIRDKVEWQAAGLTFRAGAGAAER